MKQLAITQVRGLTEALAKLGHLGDLLGNVATFSALPTVNNAGLTGLDTTQIKNEDMVIVTDATADSHGNNAIYKASTTAAAGAAVTWTFLAILSVSMASRRLGLTSTVLTVIDGTVATVSDSCYTAYTNSVSTVEVYVNGILETGFTIGTDKKLVLIGYTATGWESSDIVEVFYFGAS